MYHNHQLWQGKHQHFPFKIFIIFFRGDMCTEDGSNHDGMNRERQRGWLAMNHVFGRVCALLRICKQLLPCPNANLGSL